MLGRYVDKHVIYGWDDEWLIGSIQKKYVYMCMACTFGTKTE